MAVEQTAKLTLAKHVSQLLAHPEAEAIFPARLPSGKRHVLIALSTDSCGEVIGRLRSFKGAVNVAVADPITSEFGVVIFWPALDRDKASGPDTCEIGPESEVGLLVALLRSTRGTTRIRLTKPQYEAELVDLDTPETADC